MAEIRKLIDSWLTYAEQNGIKTTSSEGRPPEDTDLASFLSQQGWQADQFQGLIDKLPDAPEPEPEPEPYSVDASNAEIPKGERAVASDKKRYVWNNKQWIDDNSLQPATPEIQQELVAKYVKDETPAEPYNDIRPDAEANIPRRTKDIASDKKRYVWTGRKWLDDNTFEQAPKEIQNELTRKHAEQDAQPGKKEEPASDPGDPGDPAGAEQRPPLDDTGHMYLDKIKQVIKKLPRQQQKQLRRELTDD